MIPSVKKHWPKWLVLACCLSLPLSLLAQKSTYMDSLNYPYVTKQVQISESVTIAYADVGHGEHTLLFVHGLGSYLPAWQKNIATLQSSFRCIAIDLPGYGKSSRMGYSFSMSFFAEQIKSFIDQLSLKNVTLVGHSMGGQVGLTLALQHPEIIDKLVLIAPAGFETFSEQEKAWFKQIYTPEFVAATPPAQIEKNFALNFHQSVFPEDARFMYEDRLRMRADEAIYQAYCQMIPQCVLGMLNEPVSENLPNIPHPTLILYGQGDLLIPNRLLHTGLTTASVAREGQEKIPNSELHLFEACGHFVQWECAEEVNSKIESFLTNE